MFLVSLLGYLIPLGSDKWLAVYRKFLFNT